MLEYLALMAINNFDPLVALSMGAIRTYKKLIAIKHINNLFFTCSKQDFIVV
jgi:hypothetical protein